jgi:hypothetical protein
VVLAIRTDPTVLRHHLPKLPRNRWVRKAMIPKAYIGDGVYAEVDALNRIILTTEDGIAISNTVILEPEVLAMLLHYLGIAQKFNAEPLQGVWTEQDGVQSLRVEQCEIILEPRQRYCDRGNFIAKIFPIPGSDLDRDLDEQDAWPRYYMDEKRAKLEIDAWLKKRGLFETAAKEAT